MLAGATGLALLCVVAGCRHPEPPPSKALYDEAIAVLGPAPQRAGPVASPAGQVAIAQAPERHGLCAEHRGSLEGLGATVRALSDTARRLGLPTDEAAGIFFEPGAPGRARVCVLALSAAPQTMPLAGGPVAHAGHTGPYPEALDALTRLGVTVTASGHTLAAGARPRLRLLSDPDATAPNVRRSVLEVPVVR